MPVKPVYEVVAHQEGPWWVFDVPALSAVEGVDESIGAMGQSESWGRLPEHARDVIALLRDTEPADQDVTVVEWTVDRCHFTTKWSDEDGEWVGLVREFGSLSWLAGTREEALTGIRAVVVEVMADVANGGDLPD